MEWGLGRFSVRQAKIFRKTGPLCRPKFSRNRHVFLYEAYTFIRTQVLDNPMKWALYLEFKNLWYHWRCSLEGSTDIVRILLEALLYYLFNPTKDLLSESRGVHFLRKDSKYAIPLNSRVHHKLGLNQYVELSLFSILGLQLRSCKLNIKSTKSLLSKDAESCQTAGPSAG